MLYKWIVLGLIMSVISAGCSLVKEPAAKGESIRVADGVSIEGVVVGGLSHQEAVHLIREIAAEKERIPINARFQSHDTEIVTEQVGVSIDTEASLKKILDSPPNSHIRAVEKSVYPMVTHEHLRNARLVATAQTPLLDRGEDRTHNIKQAAQGITNRIISPGAVFSFNEVLGVPVEARGYRQAAIIDNGIRVMGWGGGICQISSTLYNAVLISKLQVVERHPHSKAVDYVPEGRDATTSDDKDFKFRNTSSKPLILRVIVTDEYVTTDIFELP